MTLRVKPVHFESFADVEQLRRELQAYEQELSSTTRRDWDAVCEIRGMLDSGSRLLDEEVLTWVAYDGEDAVGYLQIARGAFVGGGSGLTVKDKGWWVRPEYRPLAGRMLARAAARAIRKTRTKAVQALVLEENHRAAEVLKRNGFRPVATVYELETKL